MAAFNMEYIADQIINSATTIGGYFIITPGGV